MIILRFRRSVALPAVFAAAFFLAARHASSSAAVQTWQRTWARTSSPGGAPPVAARELADGSIMIVGDLIRTILVAARYDHDGNLLSTASFSPPFFSSFTFPPPNAMQASLVTIDPFGAVFVASASNFSRSNSNTGDIWLMKYDGLTGETKWPAPVIFDGPAHQGDIPARLLVDSQGNPVLVGQSRAGNVFSIVVFKYDGVLSALLWGPTTITGYLPAAAALDHSGNVLVGSFGSVMKLDGQTGALLWGPLSSGDSLAAVSVAPDGNVFVAGYDANHIEVAKYSGANGARLWGPSVFEEVSSPPIRATGVNVSPSGDAVLSGISGNQFVLLEYSGVNGALVWGPQRAAAGGTALTVRIAGNDDVVASGTDASNSVSTSRYGGATGIRLWGPQSDGGPSGDFYGRPTVLVCSNGRILSATVHPAGATSSLVTIERDPATGAIVWSSPFQAAGESPSSVTSMTQGPDGSVFVTGYTYSTSGQGFNFVTFKYSRADGAILWGPTFFDPSGFGRPFLVRTDSSGDAFVLGQTDSAVVLKYSGTTGALIWGPVVLSPASPWWMAIDASGDVFVLGEIDNTRFPVGDADLALFKLSGVTGAVIWGPVSFDTGAGWNDYPVEIAVTPANDLVVTGVSRDRSSVSTNRWSTLKYSGATGALLWGPSLLSDSTGTGPAGIAVDSVGDTVIFGAAGVADTDMATIKYDGATGAVLWGPKTLAGSGDYYDYVNAAVIDAVGDVLVTGSLYNLHGASSFNYDFATVKYRGSDGALLWGPQLFNGSADRGDAPYAIGLDSSGNPVVAGNSRNTAANNDIAILKYDGATGIPLWGPILAGGFGDEELSYEDLVVRGNSAVIAGTSSDRFLTAAYDEDFGIQTLADDSPPAYCGHAYSKILVAGNATGSVAWSVVSGALPAGLSLNASTGEISGTPTGVGSFAYRVQAQDTLTSASRDFVLNVFEGASFVPILSTSNPVCLGQSTTLSVSGSWTSYHWLPGGQTSPTISVSPAESTDYGVVLTDATGCVVHGSVRVSVGPLSSASVIASNNGPICEGQTLQLSASDVPGATYFWTGPGGFTSAAQNPQIVAAAASASGIYRVTVSVSGCASPPVSTSAIVRPLPSAVISAPSFVSPHSSGNGASVPSAGAGATYAWTIGNGTITGGQGTRSITFTAGAFGSVDLGVTIQDSFGCGSEGSASISIIAPSRVFASARAGNDANNCASVLTPCQTLAGAAAEVAAGGEVIVLDSGGYGPVTITRAVTIEAPPGVLAFIHPSSGDAVTINAGPSDTVVLRGLTLNVGAANGITVNTVGALHVENCVIGGFATGLSMSNAGQLFVKDTIVRGNSAAGVSMASVFGGEMASIDRSRFEGNGVGLITGIDSKVSIRRSVASGNGSGLVADGTLAELDIDACLVANNGVVGIRVGSTGGIVRVSRSTVTDNAVGLQQAGPGILLSRTDNTVEGNTTNTSGTIGSYAAK